jgi:hypothetical protein
MLDIWNRFPFHFHGSILIETSRANLLWNGSFYSKILGSMEVPWKLAVDPKNKDIFTIYIDNFRTKNTI